MNTSANNIFLKGTARFFSVCLFALLLVVSCPLKRLLRSSDLAYPSTTASTNQKNISKSVGSGFTANEICCTSTKKEAFVISTLLQKIKLPLPSCMLNLHNGTGFEISYLLSRIKNQPAYTVIFNTSSLPAYLQLRRLRI